MYLSKMDSFCSFLNNLEEQNISVVSQVPQQLDRNNYRLIGRFFEAPIEPNHSTFEARHGFPVIILSSIGSDKGKQIHKLALIYEREETGRWQLFFNSAFRYGT